MQAANRICLYNCSQMNYRRIIAASLFLALGSLFAAKTTAVAGTSTLSTSPGTPEPSPTFDVKRLNQPPTVLPPSNTDNGSQNFWGMCMSCHGDNGQGLTDEWRESYPADYRDCWQSGCHGSDHPENTFELPQTGVPAISGTGKLARFTTAFELQQYIYENMPFSPTGSLTVEQSWELTSFILRLNGNLPDNVILNKSNSIAIPIHRKVTLPPSEIPGTVLLVGMLIFSAIGLANQVNVTGKASAITRPSFLLHLHPPRIPALQSRFLYTLGAGGLAIFFSLTLLITGVLEMYFYIPSPEQAAISIATIKTLVPLGNLIRNLHYWSAQFLMVIMTIHLLRIVLTGAYAPPRRFNYLLGLALMVLLLLFNFTGYVLRWDEGVHWALSVGTNLLKTIPWIGDGVYRFIVGGVEPGAATLTRFYAWHIFGLTLVTAILMIWHAFRVRRDGGIASAPSTQKLVSTPIARAELLRREMLAMVIAIIVVILFALIFSAPTEPPITNINSTSHDSQAPWFFLWVQQLLKIGDPFWMGIMLPITVIFILGSLPYFLPNVNKEQLGRWFPKGNRIAQAVVILIILSILVLTVLGAFS